MSQQIGYPIGAGKRRGGRLISHKVVTGSSGAISSQDSRADSGIQAAKTGSETGRYTFTYAGSRPVRRFGGAFVTIVGADDAAFGAIAKGLSHIWRDNDWDGGAKDGTIELQFVTRGETNYDDAELPDSTTFYAVFFVEEGM